MAGHLNKFFEPRRAAVIGASATRQKPGNDVIQNILANEYKGDLYLVNPKGGEISGRKVYRSIQELPEKIDLAIIILPAVANAQAIREVSARGIKAAILAAGGFSEVDKNGETLQKKSSQGHQRDRDSSNRAQHVRAHLNTTQSYIELLSPWKNSKRTYFIYRPNREFCH